MLCYGLSISLFASVQVSGFLVEVRGDWKMMADIFRMPRQNTGYGICWRCNCLPGDIRQFSMDAPWRQEGNRLDHWRVVERLLQQGHQMSPLFAAPGIETTVFKFDWLHAVDQRVAADFLGNALTYFLSFEPARNQEDRCSQLWLKVQQFYSEFAVQDKLPCLKLTMLKKKSTSSPKLRAKAAEARALVPFVYLHAQKALSMNNEIHVSILNASVHLHKCYSLLSHETFVPQAMLHHSVKFLQLYAALESYFDDGTWKVKPKFHLFAELCAGDSNPSMFWTYRDEDMGGYLAATSRTRGGKRSPKAISLNVLEKFRSKDQPWLK